MYKYPTTVLSSRLFAVLSFIALAGTSVRGEDVFIVSKMGTGSTIDNMPCPPSCNSGSVSSSGSSAVSTVSPAPVIPATARKVKYGFGNGCTWSVQPTDTTVVNSAGQSYTFTSLQHVGTPTAPTVYKIYMTKNDSGSSTTDLIVNMTATGGDLSDTNGAASISVSLSAFRSTYPRNTWIPIGYITNSVNNPTIAFTWVSGNLASGVRWYMDAIRFEYIGDPCLGVVSQISADGPLAAGQAFVNIPTVTPGATNVTVYANAVQIGQTNFASGFSGGPLVVPTSALNKGDLITVTQTKTNSAGGACTSTAAPGLLVGGGPNPKIKAFVGCWKNSTNAGPIGVDGAPAGFAYILGATGLINNFGSAPVGGRELLPGACWQLISFQNRPNGDDAIDSNSGAHVTNSDAFCSLESLVFSIDDTDNGPYDIYIDQIKNGDTVVEDFESYGVGTTNSFIAPNAASPANPNPAIAYLSSPNSSLISANYAYDGTKSCRIRWQFTDTSTARWARIQAGASTGKHYPQIDTTKPITVRILVLPVNTTVDHKFNGTVGTITNSGPSYSTGTNTLGVTVTGPGPYTYLWTLNGGGLANNTDRTLTIGDPSGIGVGDNGTYQVDVSDGTCTESRTYTFTSIDPVPTITNQPSAKTIAHVGDNVSFTVGADGHVAAGYPLTYQWKFNGADIVGATDATFSTNNVQVADAGSYTLGVSNSYGGTLSSAAILDVVQAGVVIGSGTGLRGFYYTSHFSTNAFSGAPTLTRLDPTINFNFGTGSPDPSISSDFFTIRWLGEVRALDTDTYTFYTTTDDGVRLWVDNQLLVNSWVLQAPTEHSGVIALTANQQYPVVMEYYENAVGAVAQLSWSTAGGGVAKEIVPMSQLYPGAATAPSQTLGSSINNGTNLVFSFGPGSYTLQAAGVVTGPYTNVAYGITSPYTFTNALGSGPQLFYRLQVQ